jgi:hypothetical protein
MFWLVVIRVVVHLLWKVFCILLRHSILERLVELREARIFFRVFDALLR